MEGTEGRKGRGGTDGQNGAWTAFLQFKNSLHSFIFYITCVLFSTSQCLTLDFLEWAGLYSDWSGPAGGVWCISLFPIYLYVILYEILLLLYYINLTNTTPKRAYEADKADKVFLPHSFLHHNLFYRFRCRLIWLLYEKMF